MNNQSYLIYDDDKTACESLYKLLSEQTADTCIYIADNKKDAAELLKNNISVVFLDIELEHGQSGIGFARYIRKSYPKIKLIFITAHIKYCEDIFSANPSGFLVKPFTAEKISRTLSLLHSKDSGRDYIVMQNSKNSSVKIELDDISYIEAMSRKIIFYDGRGEIKYKFHNKISDLDDKLPDNFVRCHQSFLVNLDYAADIKRYSLTLSYGEVVPVSQGRFSSARNSFMRYLGESL